MDPGFDSIRSDPRYSILMRRLQLAGVDQQSVTSDARAGPALLHGGAYQATITPKSGRARRGLGKDARVGSFDTDVDGAVRRESTEDRAARWLAAKSRRRSVNVLTGAPRVRPRERLRRRAPGQVTLELVMEERELAGESDAWYDLVRPGGDYS